jgi:Cu2+-exporting ATPase
MPVRTECRCFHCGQPVADPARWTVRVRNQLEPMCCPACQTVASAIIAGGLENYYRFRSQPARQPDIAGVPGRDAWLAYDDPVWQTSFVRHFDAAGQSQAEVQLSVSDIHCAACCWLIEQAIQKFPDASIRVNLATHQAVLRWNPSSQTLGQLLAAIGRVGYTALPNQASEAREQSEREHRRQLIRLGIAGLAMMQAMMFALALYSGDWSGMEPEQQQLMRWFSLVIILPVMFYSALPFYRGAWRSVKALGAAGMDVPVSLALWIAFAASLYSVVTGHGAVYFDSISMFVFLLLLARFTEARVRNNYFGSQLAPLPVSCSCLTDVVNHPASIVSKPVHQVNAGEMILVRAGETIPLDGVIADGSGTVNEASFSGEQLPLPKTVGDIVYAGTINGDGVLTLRITHTAGQTRFDELTRLGEWGSSQKPAIALLADKLASGFTLCVLVLALVSGWFWAGHDSSRAFSVVLSILVVSCPCALSLATPAALSFCYQTLRQHGALMISGNTTDHLAAIDRVVFDKTGTLTDGRFSLVRTESLLPSGNITQLRELASALETYSGHPLAHAFRDLVTDITLADVRVVSGRGIEALHEATAYRIGSREFCRELAVCDLPVAALVADDACKQILPVYLVKAGQWLARFDLADQLRPEAKQVVATLQRQGKTVEILSGDSSGASEKLAQQLGIVECRSAASPEQKLAHIRHLQQQGYKVLMIGDGINDIPVLAQADASVAMPGASDLAKIKADIVLLHPSLTLVLDVLGHAHKTRAIIRQNIAWALLYNGIALPLAAAGLVQPWLAALGMSLSSLWVTFNSLRLRKL